MTAAGQSADEARVQASGAWHTARHLAGTDGAHSMVRKAAGTGLRGGVPDQVGWVGDVQLAGPVEHHGHHGHQGLGHATWCRWEAPPPVSMAPMPAIASWPPGRRARQKAPFSLPGRSATLTGISGTGFGAHSPSWLARTGNTGRRDAASPAWNWLPRASAAGTHMQRTASRSSRP